MNDPYRLLLSLEKVVVSARNAMHYNWSRHQLDKNGTIFAVGSMKLCLSHIIGNASSGKNTHFQLN